MAPRHLLVLLVAIYSCSNGSGQGFAGIIFPQYTLLSPPFVAHSPYYDGKNSLMSKSAVQGRPEEGKQEYEKKGMID